MQLHYPASVDDIDLSNWDFWRKGLEERKALLRCCAKSTPLLSSRKVRQVFRYRERAIGY